MEVVSGTFRHFEAIDVRTHTDDVSVNTCGWFELGSVRGVVRVVPPGQAWSTATSVTSCDWAFDVALGGRCGFQNGYGGVDNFDYLERIGFSLDSGCRLRGSSFLPSRVWPVGPDLHRAILAPNGGQTYGSYTFPLWKQESTLWYTGSATWSWSGPQNSAYWVGNLAPGVRHAAPPAP